MNNKQAVIEIIKHAQEYQNNLLDKNILFAFQQNNSIEFIESEFLDKRFLHLTGVSIDLSIVRGSSDFFNLAANGNLKDTHFTQNNPKIIASKLSALDQTMSIQTTAREVGDFQNNGGNLYTEKLSGSAKAC
ncbi:hypothetical protein FACS1894132_13340 [Clostridia bacterium]|nr:hypothetical protein FACS1894132_13340 [Clostridia bacterium]